MGKSVDKPNLLPPPPIPEVRPPFVDAKATSDASDPTTRIEPPQIEAPGSNAPPVVAPPVSEDELTLPFDRSMQEEWQQALAGSFAKPPAGKPAEIEDQPTLLRETPPAPEDVLVAEAVEPAEAPEAAKTTEAADDSNESKATEAAQSEASLADSEEAEALEVTELDADEIHEQIEEEKEVSLPRPARLPPPLRSKGRAHPPTPPRHARPAASPLSDQLSVYHEESSAGLRQSEDTQALITGLADELKDAFASEAPEQTEAAAVAPAETGSTAAGDPSRRAPSALIPFLLSKKGLYTAAGCMAVLLLFFMFSGPSEESENTEFAAKSPQHLPKKQAVKQPPLAKDAELLAARSDPQGPAGDAAGNGPVAGVLAADIGDSETTVQDDDGSGSESGEDSNSGDTGSEGEASADVAGLDPAPAASTRAKKKKKRKKGSKKAEANKAEPAAPAKTAPAKAAHAKSMSASEAMAAAEKAWRAGKASETYRLASKAHAKGTGSKAAELMVLSACRMSRKSQAKSALKKVSLFRRPRVRSKCKDMGQKI